MTDSAWCAKKNDGAGHAVSAKLDEFNAWQCDAQRQIRSERIPGVTVEMPAEVLREVLSPEECQSLIEGIPKGGAGHMDGAEVSQLYRDRVLASRYLSHDPKLALQVMDRISAYLPGGLDGGRLFRVSPTFRFLHYEEGGRQGCHIDGREPAEPVLEEAAGGWVQSRLTLQMYLNSHGVDFEGGELGLLSFVPSIFMNRAQAMLLFSTRNDCSLLQTSLTSCTMKPAMLRVAISTRVVQ